RARRVDRAMDDESGFVYRPTAFIDSFSVEVDFYQIGSGNLLVEQSKRIDQELVATGNARGDVVEDQLAPSQSSKLTINRRQLAASFAFRVAYQVDDGGALFCRSCGCHDVLNLLTLTVMLMLAGVIWSAASYSRLARSSQYCFAKA